jgi:site-specific DNA-methyltransferase (adenine-specific)
VATFEIHHGDNRDVLKTLADNSVDSVVTDPPYELGFMGKSWDASGIAYSVELWQEVLHVLKPGGHLLAFSGSRTYHRMVVAIEDAGFEIRDQIMWIYGSGFPKSLNIAKAMDKASGFEGQVIGKGTSWNRPDSEEGDIVRMNVSPGEYDIKELSPTAKQWQGWGTALKPAHEPVVVARKPLIGTVAANVLTYGTGGLNIDRSRVAHLSEADRASATPQGKVTSNKMAGATPDVDNAGRVEVERPDTSLGRWPANVIHDGSDEVVELFPRAKGGAYPAVRGKSDIGAFALGGQHKDKPNQARIMGDDGSAARFFYCAKASKKDRNEGLESFSDRRQDEDDYERAGTTNPRNRSQLLRKNHHPTVKPTELMRYLCRLVTPPNGVVLDPFMGSGSTGKAAIYEGFNFVGIEMTDEYIPIAKARIEFAVNEMADKLL